MSLVIYRDSLSLLEVGKARIRRVLICSQDSGDFLELFLECVIPFLQLERGPVVEVESYRARTVMEHEQRKAA